MQRIMGMARKAITEYDMIQNGDRVAVGVSGGKDSVALTMALHWLRRFIGIDYEVVAITLDPCFGGVECDYSPLAELFEREGIEYVIKRTNIGRVVFDVREETNPCSLCAKMRRGALHDTAKELGCNKLALGHHKDDAVETFIMNLFDQGRIGCFSPVSYLSRKDLTVIRPLILAEEKEVKQAVRREKFPIIKSSCPVDGHTNGNGPSSGCGRWSTRSGTSNRRYSVPCGGRISATGKRRSGTSCECGGKNGHVRNCRSARIS